MPLDTTLKKDLLKILGIRGNIHGDLYQLNLIALAAIRAHNNQQKFCLTSDAEEFGKFDDVVIDYGDLIIFLQAKHSEQTGESNSYKDSDLCADPNSSNNAFSLAKYFDSWYELYESKYTLKGDRSKKKTQFIFLTNKSIESHESFLREFVLDSDTFLFEATKTLKFKADEKFRKKFIDAIRAGSKYTSDNIPITSFENAEEVLKNKLAEYILANKSKEIIVANLREANIDIKTLLIEVASKKETRTALIEWIKNHKPKGAKRNFDSKEFREFCKNKILYQKPIPENDVQKLINRFLDELIIKIEQPNETNLFKIIKKELKSSQNFASSEIFYQFYTDILKWLKNKNNSILDNTELTSEITNIINDLRRFYLLGGTLIYKKESEQFISPLIQIPEILEFKEWLLAADNYVMLLSDIQENGAIEKRVYQTVKQQNYEDSKWHFVTLNSEYLEYVEGALYGESTQLTIIDCRYQTFTEQLLEKISNFKNVVRSNNKKLILIVKPEQIENDYFLEDTKLDVGLLSDSELVQLSQNYQDKYVSLGSRLIQIGLLLSEQTTGIYNSMRELGNLHEMILYSEMEYKINTYHLPYNIYIENGLSEGEPIYQNLGEFIQKADVRLFIVFIQNDSDRDYRDKKRDLIKTLEDYFNNEENKFRFSRTFQEDTTRYLLIELLTNQDEYQCKRIYFSSAATGGYEDACHLKYQEDKFTITRHPLEVVLPFASDYKFKLVTDLRNVILTDQKYISILSSIAGYGKSSFCHNIMNEWLGGDVHNFSWIFMVYLPQVKFTKPNSQIDILDILDKSNLNSWQLKAINYDLKHNPSKVMFLLDSLDEVKKNNIVNFLNEWLVIVPDKRVL